MQPSLSPQLTPRIVVDQPVALYDAPLSIALEGFESRTRVTVTATFQVAEATPWRSWATFIADDGGRVDVTRQAPVAGTWEGLSPMGLFWSATPVLTHYQATRFLDLFGSSDYSRVTFVGSPRRAGPFVSLASGLGAPAPGRPCGSHSGPATSCGSHDICRRGRGGDDGSPHRW